MNIKASIIKVIDFFVELVRENISKVKNWCIIQCTKIWDTFRYDIPRFLKNIVKFRKALYNFHCFDHIYNMELYKKSLEITCEYIEKKSMENGISKFEKVEEMKEVIKMIDNYVNNKYYNIAEKQLGFKYNYKATQFVPCVKKDGSERNMILETIDEDALKSNHKLVQQAKVIARTEWQKIFEIIFNNSQQWWW